MLVILCVHCQWLLVQSCVSSVCTHLSSTRHPIPAAERRLAPAEERPFCASPTDAHPSERNHHHTSRQAFHFYFIFHEKWFQSNQWSPVRLKKTTTTWNSWQDGSRWCWGRAVYKFFCQIIQNPECLGWYWVKCGQVIMNEMWLFTSPQETSYVVLHVPLFQRLRKTCGGATWNKTTKNPTNKTWWIMKQDIWNERGRRCCHCQEVWGTFYEPLETIIVKCGKQRKAWKHVNTRGEGVPWIEQWFYFNGWKKFFKI